MGRGVGSCGGESSLGYLFGGGDAPASRVPALKTTANNVETPLQNQAPVRNAVPEKPSIVAAPADVGKQIPAGIQGSQKNNYFRANGQNTGNFLTDRPCTKIQAAPGGGSSLGYLFGGDSN